MSRHRTRGAAIKSGCMTEEQAAKKDCCVGGFTTGNRGKCVGSACMGWRWFITNEYGGMHATYIGSDVHDVGYCGRAGDQS